MDGFSSKENIEKPPVKNKYAAPLAYHCKFESYNVSLHDITESEVSAEPELGTPSFRSSRKSSRTPSVVSTKEDVVSSYFAKSLLGRSKFMSSTTAEESLLPVPKHFEDPEPTLLEKGRKKRINRGLLAERAEVIRSQVIFDELAMEWLTCDNWNMETLIYLIDKLFPILVMGLVKVIGEAEKRNLLGKDEPDPNFNPLNYLARFLLKNNPRFGDFNEGHPYVCGVRYVAEKLRRQMDVYIGSSLGFLKMEAHERRKNCEMEQFKRNQERLRRTNALRDLFYAWNEGKRIPLLMTQNALLSFKDREPILDYKDDEGLILPIDFMTNQGGDTFLHADRFIEYIMEPTSNLTPKQFNQFIDHMMVAGIDFKAISRQNDVRYQLQQLFHNCDVIKIEYLDKSKVMKLLSDFYTRLTVSMQEKLVDPKCWPINEIGDLSEDPIAGSEYEWMMVDLSKGIHPPDDYIMDECPPDQFSVELLKTPVWPDMPYVDFFTNANVKFANLDYQLFQDMEIMKWEAKKLDLKNIKILPLTPNKNELYIFSQQLNLKERVELGNKLDILPVWKLQKVRDMDKESGLISRNHFCGLVMNFLGPAISNQEVINKLGVFLIEGCKMHDEEKVAMLYKWKDLREKEKSNLLISEIFELWDSDASGYLSLDLTMNKLKGLKLFHDNALDFRVMKAYQDKYGANMRKMSKFQFKFLMELVIQLLPDTTTTEAFLENFFQTYDPGPMKMRSLEAKKKLIHQILLQATFSPNEMRPVFQETLSVMKKDDYEMSSDKFLSATISLLERKKSIDYDIDYILRLHAKTSDKKYADVGSCLEPHHASLSYKVIKSKEMVVIQKIRQHPFPLADLWDRHVREEIGEGQMVFVPLMDEQRRVFGVFVVDNLPVILKPEDERRISLVEGKIIIKAHFPSIRSNESSTQGLRTSLPPISPSKMASLKSRSQVSQRKSKHLSRESFTTHPQQQYSLDYNNQDRNKAQRIHSKIRPPPDVEVSIASSSDKLKTSEGPSKSASRSKRRSRLGVNRSQALRFVSGFEEVVPIKEEKIEFFQGIGKAISITLHQHCQFVKIQKCYKVILETFSYLTPSILWCGVYRVAYDISIKDVFLQEIMNYVYKGGKVPPVIKVREQRLPMLVRMKNLYRPFVFECVDSGNPIIGSCLSEHYIALPIKDLENQVKFMVVVNIGNKSKMLKLEMSNLLFYEKFFTRMLHYIIRLDTEIPEPVRTVEEPKKEQIEIICWKFCLEELYDKLSKHLRGQSWCKFTSLARVSIQINDMFDVVLQLLYPGVLHDPRWREIAPYLAGNISLKLGKFDPNKTMKLFDEEIQECLETLIDIPIHEFYRTNYPPLLYFHEWALIALTSIQKFRIYEKESENFVKGCYVI